MKTIHERLDILDEKMRSENFRENKGLKKRACHR